MTMASNSSSSSKSKQRQPIHYSFISIDEECNAPQLQSESSSTPRCFNLLQQFYNELMIPTFPLEEERDDIEDWFECFTLQRKLRWQKDRIKKRRQVRDTLAEGLGEDGVADVVQQFALESENVGEEEDCEFDGPAMDVILMVQDVVEGSANNNNEDDDERYFFKRSSRSLLNSQSSLYGGLYAPKEDTNATSSYDTRRSSLLRNQSSTITEGEVATINGEIGNGSSSHHDTNQQQASVHGRRNLLKSQSSLYGGLYAPSDHDEEEEGEDWGRKCVIIGGAAVEYYRQSRVGLLSYVVLHSDFRGCGLAKFLHKEALSRLEMLANCYGHSISKEEIPTQLSSQLTTQPSTSSVLSQDNTQPPLLQAIFAETNTPSAGDVTPHQSLLRHKSLYNLGYRLVHFPYAQPPLTTEDVNASFDEIVLLVYFPFDENGITEEFVGGLNCGDFEKELLMKQYCPWYLEKHCSNDEIPTNTKSVQMNVSIPFRYIEDFYQSVFGYEESDCENNNNALEEENEDGKERIPDYRTANYYKLAHWFTHNRQQSKDELESKGLVEVSLCRPAAPWVDCKDSLLLEWEKWQEADRVEYH